VATDICEGRPLFIQGIARVAKTTTRQDWSLPPVVTTQEEAGLREALTQGRFRETLTPDPSPVPGVPGEGSIVLDSSRPRPQPGKHPTFGKAPEDRRRLRPIEIPL
jgi:hypothetical protein